MRMELVHPPPLRPGDCVGLVSTSSPVTADKLDRIITYLRDRDYRVKAADGILDRVGHFGGSAEQRAAGVMRMFADPEVSLVLPVDGGTGAAHLVDALDYDLIRANPKVFAGFSDPTVLNNSLLAAAGLPSVHGISGFQFFGWPDHDEPTETAFWRMVSGPIAGQEIAGEGWRVYRSDGGTVSGMLVGGNATAVATVAGTAWMPPTSGAILLFEAMTATFDDIDHQLSQLRLAGVFDDIAALVVGAPADWERENAPDADTDELILRCVRGTFPIITGVPFGHQQAKIQLPIGCRAEVDLRGHQPVLRYLEDLVRHD